MREKVPRTLFTLEQLEKEAEEMDDPEDTGSSPDTIG